MTFALSAMLWRFAIAIARDQAAFPTET